MKRYFYSYTSSTNFSSPISNHSFILRCQPQENSFQQIKDSHIVIPDTFWHRQLTDGFGNEVIYGGMRDFHLGFAYESCGVAELSEYRIDEASPNPIYGKSRCINALEKAEELCEMVYSKMLYFPGATSVSTSVEEAWQMKRGVCQDFAQIFVSFCRKEGIVARYVCGIIAGEGKTHAWAEVWSDGVWYGFDPTHNCRFSDGYLKIAHGRNAADCSVNRGIYCGNTIETTIVNTILQEI